MKHFILHKFRDTPTNRLKSTLQFLGIFGVLLAVSILVWGFFSSEDALQDLLSAMGPAAPILFIFIQTTQTVTPFIPAALSSQSAYSYSASAPALCSALSASPWAL